MRGAGRNWRCRRTNRRWEPNVHYHRIWLAEEQRYVRLKLSTRALREIERKGLLRALRDGMIANLK
jgi:large subunit ribosomal protein L28